MTKEEFAEIVRLLRRRGGDLQLIEAKASTQKLPKSTLETLSAFRNGSGGLLILGLAEETGFTGSSDFDANKISSDLASACADQVEPPIRAEISILDFEGNQVVAAYIDEASTNDKPCFVKSRGTYQGSFVRSGDGDRRMTDYEVGLLVANRGQPTDDHDVVDGASVADLNTAAVARLLERVRARQPTVFAYVSDEIALVRLGVLRQIDATYVPTVAGLLALGEYPQQYFPRLIVTFTVFNGVSKDAIPAGSERFLDSRNISGSIPQMISDTLNSVTRNMSLRSRIEGAGREDIYDYPVAALREAVVNSLIHRDYSSVARGTAVQVEMYTDRLVIKNAGGLFGTVTTDDLGREGVSSSRNSYLATLLHDVALPNSDRVVCENRAHGIPTIMQKMREAGMSPPEFRNRISQFSITFPRHTLLDSETVEWINSLEQKGLTKGQLMALALLHQDRELTNGMLQQLGCESRSASQDLANLVERELVVKTPGRRYARYLLLERTPTRDVKESGRTSGEPKSRRNRSDDVLALFRPGRRLTLQQVAIEAGVSYAMAHRYVTSLVEDGRLKIDSHHLRPIVYTQVDARQAFNE